MGERISPAALSPEEVEARGTTSIENVVSALSNSDIFPWIERCLITGHNSDCDIAQIDLILFADQDFTNITGLDTITVQVKSAEHDMTWFQGVVGANGKIHNAKFLHHTSREWVAVNLTFLDGQWPADLIAADFMFQICAQCGHWQNTQDTFTFATKVFPPKAVEIMREKLGRICDFRGRYLDWIVLGVEALEAKPL